MADYLHNKYSFAGLLGNYSFDSNGDATGTKPVIQQIQNHALVQLES